MRRATAAPAAIRIVLGCVATTCVIALVLAGPAWGAEPVKGAGDQAKTAEKTLTKDDIKALAADYFERGAAARDQGKLQLARALLRSTLRLDPSNAKAQTMLEEVEKALGITDADRIREKLELRIPEVRFQDADVKEVVEYLAKEAQVNIVFDIAALNLLEPAAQTAPGAVPDTEPGGFGPEPGAADLEPGAAGLEPGAFAPSTSAAPPTNRITIHLKNVPLKEVLRYVLRYKNLRYIVEDYAILIVPVDWQPPEPMVTEIFHMTTSGVGAARAINEMTGGESAWSTGSQ
jgi:tetratricopeptide (TPR) repeat protein